MDSYLGADARILDQRRGVVFDRPAVLAAVARQIDALARLGVSKGDRVALAHGDGPAFIADLLAIWSRGATA